MPANISSVKKYRQSLLIALCTLAAFYLQYIFRSFDDNRLTSWKWAFAGIDLSWFIPVLIVLIIISYLLFRSSFTEKRPALFLLVLSFGVTSIFWKLPEVIIDTSRYFTYAKHLELYGVKYFLSEWGQAVNIWTDMPFVPFLYGLIFKYIGESRIFIQIFVSALFSMTVVLTYLTGRTLWNSETGLLAGAFILGIPYIFSQTPLMLVDVPTMFFLMLSIYLFVRAMEEGGGWTVFASLALFCTVFSKYSTWMMLSVTGVIFIVYLKLGSGKRKQIIYRGVIIALLSTLLIGIVFIFKFDVIWGQVRFLREYQMPGLKWWGESFTSTFLYQVHPFITIAAMFSLFAAFKRRDLKFLIIGWLMFLIVILEVRRSRYVMVLFPMLALMASYGLQMVKEMELRKCIVSCAVASSLAVAVFAYLPFLQSMGAVNFRDAGRALNSSDVERVIVFTIPSSETVVNQAVGVPVLDLFAEKKISYYHDGNYALPLEKIEKSPLRFTWVYKNPEYYDVINEDSTLNSAIAVISNAPLEELPDNLKKKVEGHREAGIFKTTTGIFRYSPVVTVYLP
jgi:4-amino-4-deoxy-L-arabinose transferase-like glycosyltransferase